jgi:hypothetical protein
MLDNLKIKIIGNFLYNYESDLKFILEFQKWKSSNYLDENYLGEEKLFGLVSFLKEYKVLRWIKKDQQPEFINLIKMYFIEKSDFNVDELNAFVVKNYSINTNCNFISLCSKIGMLYNPVKYFPLDRYSKNAIEYKDNNYINFNAKIKDFVQNSEIKEFLDEIIIYTLPILTEFESKLVIENFNIESVRENRILDKILWNLGRNKLKSKT